MLVETFFRCLGNWIGCCKYFVNILCLLGNNSITTLTIFLKSRQTISENSMVHMYSYLITLKIERGNENDKFCLFAQNYETITRQQKCNTK